MIRRFMLLTAALVVATGLFARPASATETGTYTGVVGWDNVFDPTSSGTPNVGAGRMTFSFGGTTVGGFCVERTTPVNESATFTAQPASGTAQAKAAWLAANHGTVGTPEADARYENSAVSIAIWSFTDGDTVNATTVPDNTVRNRALALIAAAQSATLPTAANPALTVTVARNGATATATATLSGVDGISGRTVTFTAGSTTLTGTTNAQGAASVTLPASATSVNASVTGTIGAGVLLVPNDSSQKVITDTAIPFTVQGSAVVPQATTTTVAPPTTAAAPTTTAAPSPAGNTLPHTGPGASPWLAVTGLALVGLSAVAVRRSRRS